MAAGIDVLKEEEIIDSSKTEMLEEKLSQLQEDASGEDPVKTWEALDHLENTLSKESTGRVGQPCYPNSQQLTTTHNNS